MAKKKSKGGSRGHESQRKSYDDDQENVVTPLMPVSKTRSRMQNEGISPIRCEFGEELVEHLLTEEQTLEELIHGSREKSKLNQWLNFLKEGEANDRNRVEENRVQNSASQVPDSSTPLLQI